MQRRYKLQAVTSSRYQQSIIFDDPTNIPFAFFDVTIADSVRR